MDSWANAVGSSGAIYHNSGNVGIGTSSPRSALDVAGVFLESPSFTNSSTTIDFANGNIQNTTASCGAFILNNLKDGGSYMLIVKGATAGKCTFTGYTGIAVGALIVHMPPDNAATTAATHTIFNIVVSGGDVYVAWTPGY
jgi:hypothetical protein